MDQNGIVKRLILIWSVILTLLYRQGAGHTFILSSFHPFILSSFHHFIISSFHSFILSSCYSSFHSFLYSPIHSFILYSLSINFLDNYYLFRLLWSRSNLHRWQTACYFRVSPTHVHLQTVRICISFDAEVACVRFDPCVCVHVTLKVLMLFKPPTTDGAGEGFLLVVDLHVRC